MCQLAVSSRQEANYNAQPHCLFSAQLVWHCVNLPVVGYRLLGCFPELFQSCRTTTKQQSAAVSQSHHRLAPTPHAHNSASGCSVQLRGLLPAAAPACPAVTPATSASGPGPRLLHTTRHTTQYSQLCQHTTQYSQLCQLSAGASTPQRCLSHTAHPHKQKPVSSTAICWLSQTDSHMLSLSKEPQQQSPAKPT